MVELCFRSWINSTENSWIRSNFINTLFGLTVDIITVFASKNYALRAFPDRPAESCNLKVITTLAEHSQRNWERPQFYRSLIVDTCKISKCSLHPSRNPCQQQSHMWSSIKSADNLSFVSPGVPRQRNPFCGEFRNDPTAVLEAVVKGTTVCFIPLFGGIH